MINKRIAYPLIIALAASISLAACKKNEPTPPVEPVTPVAPVEPATPAAAATVSVTALTLGNAVDANNKVATPATAFAPGDTIYASVDTATSDPAATVEGKLDAKWTYQDGQTVDEDDETINFAGTGTTAFNISHPDGFPTGKYKVEIKLNDAVVQSAEFEVK